MTGEVVLVAVGLEIQSGKLTLPVVGHDSTPRTFIIAPDEGRAFEGGGSREVDVVCEKHDGSGPVLGASGPTAVGQHELGTASGGGRTHRMRDLSRVFHLVKVGSCT